MNITDNVDAIPTPIPSPTSSSSEDDNACDRDLSLYGDGDRFFHYNEQDVNAFFKKILFGVGNPDARLKKFGSGLRKAIEENNLLDVVLGTLHLAVIYEAEQKGLFLLSESKIETKKAKRQRRRKIRRLDDSTTNNNIDTVEENESLNNGSSTSSETESNMEGEETLEKAGEQRKRKIRRLDDSTINNIDTSEENKPLKPNDGHGQLSPEDNERSDSAIFYPGGVDNFDLTSEEDELLKSNDAQLSPEDEDSYQAEKQESPSEKRVEGDDDETLKKSKSRRQRRSKKRRIDSSSSSENVTKDEETLKLKKKVLKKTQRQQNQRRLENSTHDDGGSEEDKLPKAKPSDEQLQSEYHPDDDEDKQSISSDSTVLFSMRKRNLKRQGKDVIVVKEESRSPTLPEDIEIDHDSADSGKDLNSFPNIEDFDILEPAGSGTPTTNTGQIERNKHACHICRKGFRLEKDLKRHLTVHSDERNFPCPHPGCGKEFKDNYQRNRHLLRHSGKKPFKCEFPGCSAAFPANNDLKRHQLVHTEERPFWCPCGKQFKDNNRLKRHQRNCPNRN